MRASLKRLFLSALHTDAEAVFADDAWATRCLHCRSRLHVRKDGEPLGHASLEHVVAMAWFGRRAAADLVARAGGVPDAPQNLAIACARCNHAKGKAHDARGPSDPRALEVVGALLDARQRRWRNPIS